MSKNLKVKRKSFVTPILVKTPFMTKMGVTDCDTGWQSILVTPHFVSLICSHTLKEKCHIQYWTATN